MMWKDKVIYASLINQTRLALKFLTKHVHVGLFIYFFKW